MHANKKKRCSLAMSYIRNAINVNSFRFKMNDSDLLVIENCYFDNADFIYNYTSCHKPLDFFCGEYQGEYALAYSVLEQAVHDLSENNRDIALSAERFLKDDPWCTKFLKINNGYMLMILRKYNLID